VHEKPEHLFLIQSLRELSSSVIRHICQIYRATAGASTTTFYYTSFKNNTNRLLASETS